MYEALREQQLEAGDDPDEGPSTAVDYIIETDGHETIADLLRDLLRQRAGMSDEEIGAALEKAAGAWLSDQREQWYEA